MTKNRQSVEEDGNHASNGCQFTASACAKLILCGEHAVTYGRPAIALPLTNVRASVTIEKSLPGSGIWFDARDLGQRWALIDKRENPLSVLVANVLAHFAIETLPDLLITITSAIPIASGMGSSAAVATAIVRAIAGHLGNFLPPEEVSALVFGSECLYHGISSGLDNTVIAFEQPIWFVHRMVADHRPPIDNSSLYGMSSIATSTSNYKHTMSYRVIEPITISGPFTLLIGDTGIRKATKLPIDEVQRHWKEKPTKYESIFDAIAELVTQARSALNHGEIALLGTLLDKNHTLLKQIGVSSPELDTLVAAAHATGAFGAKLSGAGWGGVMFALVSPECRERVTTALTDSGAVRVLEIVVSSHHP